MSKASQPTALNLPMVDPLPPETQKYFDVCQQKLGMVPNVLQAYAFDIDKLNAFTAMYNDLMLADSGLDLARIVALLSWQPAAIAGMGDRHGRPIEPGSPANLTVIDPDMVWTVRGAEMGSHSKNTPFEGRELKGKVRHTVYDGELVVMNGRAVR